jgi:hypothetical protein
MGRGDFMTIKAIETKYKGYRFRSRLEARWAVAFDELGVKWEYEPQGYDLGEIGWYLPDFWLPTQKCWIEIKSVEPSFEEDAKAEGLAVATEKWVDVIVGPPGEHEIFGYRHYERWRTMPLRARKVRMWLCENCGDIVFLSSCGIAPWSHIGHCYNCLGMPVIDKDAYRKDEHLTELHRAFDAARSARFEHGESGYSR